jgi:hypothetical protein
VIRYQLDAFRFREGQWWWLPARTLLTRTRIGAWWLRRRQATDVQWRIERVGTMGGRR